MNSAKVLRQMWAKGETAFGAWSALPSAFAAELMAIPGVSYICIDQQHGMIDYPMMVEMLRGIEGRGPVAFTRVPENQTWLISKALDAGIQGIIVPMVNNRAQAAAAVAACRFPPHGNRSYGPIRAALTMESRDIATIGGEVLCFVMIETKEAVERIDEIASTPGLDGIYIGPADLALGLGLPPDLDKQEPEHVAAVARILASCQRHGIVAGIQCGSGASGRKYSEMGFRLVTVAKDTSLIQSAVKGEIKSAFGGTAPGEGPAAGYT